MTKNPLLIFFLALALGAGLGIWINQTWINPSPGIGQVRLEEVLVVKELHLVRHNYNDLFFVHRKNDKSKAIRAIAEVPVTVTAFINLKEMKWEKRNDSIKQVVLPVAQLNDPAYGLDQMVIKETRGFQFHVGKDLYPQVSKYIGQIIAERKDTIRNRAIENKILQQAEVEGKQYIEGLLRSIGREDVKVTFGNAAVDATVATLTPAFSKTVPPADSTNPARAIHATINSVFYGWIPVN